MTILLPQLKTFITANFHSYNHSSLQTSTTTTIRTYKLPQLLPFVTTNFHNYSHLRLLNTPTPPHCRQYWGGGGGGGGKGGTFTAKSIPQQLTVTAIDFNGYSLVPLAMAPNQMTVAYLKIPACGRDATQKQAVNKRHDRDETASFTGQLLWPPPGFAGCPTNRTSICSGQLRVCTCHFEEEAKVSGNIHWN
jgi:hypothetical protein